MVNCGNPVKIPEDKLWLHNMNKELSSAFNIEEKGCGKLFAAVPARFSENAKAVLSARYLQKDEHGAQSESGEQMFRRVAREVDRHNNRTDRDDIYNRRVFERH
jgi:ribonucleotide reductase alpha subunit